MNKLLTIFILFVLAANLQAIESQYIISSQSVMQHIEVLAADSLEGREVGEPGELKAAEYIRSIFKTAGLLSEGTDNYFQYYDFLKKIQVTEQTTLKVNYIPLVLHEDFIPLQQSASKSFKFTDVVDVGYGIKTGDDSNSYNDYANKDVSGKAVLIARFAPPSKDYPHTDFSKHELIIDKINIAIKHNVSGIFFYTPKEHDDTLLTYNIANIYAKDIPIIFIKRRAFEKLKLISNTNFTYEGNVELVKVWDTAQNVIGIVKGETDSTVIIGAHYDHLGWGTPASTYHGVPAIHNGADDNASGVAALLELARKYAHADKKPHYTMLFIAFSGEEAGLLGSSYFAKHMTVDSTTIRMMINMDMIGRLKDQDKGLAILGVGSTSEFTNFFDSLNYQDIKLTLSKSGYGASDHTVFTARGIPSLHLFTGAHKDYHKPSDDIDKIDADGIVKVTTFVDRLLTYFDNLDKPLVFTKTKDSSHGKRRKKYSVTLGVIPDYVSEVQGFKIDGVTKDKPAEKAGIIKGDIIIQLGEVVINDIYDYMNALSKFKKGDTVKAVVVRKGKQIELSVTF